MYCRNCGNQLSDMIKFCPTCGTATDQRKNETIINSVKKHWKPILAVAVVAAIIIAIVCSSGSTSIVGVWIDGTDRVVFTKDGEYKNDDNYGTYTITSDKTLVIDYGYYSYFSGTERYKWGSEAKEDYDYWYVSGDTLYFRGREYTKK